MNTLEATSLGNGRYAVRPRGQLGTCGWYPWAWTAVFITARNAADAIRKARPAMVRQQRGRVYE